MISNKNFKITSQEQGLRIDRFLVNQGLAFALIQKLIRKKLIKVNQKKTEISYRLNQGDEVEILANLDFKQKIKIHKSVHPNIISDFKKSIIFQDKNLIVINKEAGLAVQGGSGIKIAIDDILPYLKFDSLENPKLVHRIDKDTSGILLLARSRKTADFLTAAFREKTIKKTYLALVKGIPTQKSGVINFPLLKKYQGANEKVYRDEINGKEAVTYYRLLDEYPKENLALLEVNPVTGRTHQIRVHLKEIGHPIIGDFKYGGKNSDFEKLNLKKRLYLHAFKIEISDYLEKSKLTISTHINLSQKDYLKVF